MSILRRDKHKYIEIRKKTQVEAPCKLLRAMRIFHKRLMNSFRPHQGNSKKNGLDKISIKFGNVH